MRSVVVPVLMVASSLAVIVAASGFYLVAGYKSERVTRGVSVRDIDLSGMTAEEARAALGPTLNQLTSEPIALTHGEDTWEVTRGELGLVIDVDGTIAAAMAVGHSGGVIDAWRIRRAAASDGVQVPVATIIREPALVGALGRLAGDLQRKAEPARVDYDRSTGMISVRRDVVGRVLDTAATRELVLQSVDDPGTVSIPLAVTESYAEPRYDDLKHINAVLGSFSTNYNMGDSNRSHNIALAAQALDQAVIEAGATLSYNQRVGERTTARGYKMAHVYEEGEVRDGIGGGICQVSSTLFNTALVAGLEIVTRHPHMMPVSYLETGRDATVDWGSGIDLVIRNNSSKSVILRSFGGGGTMSCLFLGSADDKPEKVEIVRSNVTASDYSVIEQVDSSLEPGARVVDQEGRRGFTATVHRIIKRRGQEEKRELVSNDRHSKRNAIVRVGPPLPEAPPPAPEEPAAEPAPEPATEEEISG